MSTTPKSKRMSAPPTNGLPNGLSLPNGTSSPALAKTTKDSILEDLRRQLEDSDISSHAGSSQSSQGGRRRRRNRGRGKKNAQQNGNGALLAGMNLNNTKAAVLPRVSETKPVRLQLGLNLDIELELKARIQGDVSLTLLND